MFVEQVARNKYLKDVALSLVPFNLLSASSHILTSISPFTHHHHHHHHHPSSSSSSSSSPPIIIIIITHHHHHHHHPSSSSSPIIIIITIIIITHYLTVMVYSRYSRCIIFSRILNYGWTTLCKHLEKSHGMVPQHQNVNATYRICSYKGPSGYLF